MDAKKESEGNPPAAPNRDRATLACSEKEDFKFCVKFSCAEDYADNHNMGSRTNSRADLLQIKTVDLYLTIHNKSSRASNKYRAPILLILTL